jgi:hypothetical protein
MFPFKTFWPSSLLYTSLSRRAHQSTPPIIVSLPCRGTPPASLSPPPHRRPSSWVSIGSALATQCLLLGSLMLMPLTEGCQSRCATAHRCASHRLASTSATAPAGVGRQTEMAVGPGQQYRAASRNAGRALCGYFPFFSFLFNFQKFR